MAQRAKQTHIAIYLKSITRDFYNFKKKPVNFIAQTEVLNDEPGPNEIFVALMYRNSEFHDELLKLYSRFAQQIKLNQAIKLLEKVNFTTKKLIEYEKLNLPLTAKQLQSKFEHAKIAFTKQPNIKFKFK